MWKSGESITRTKTSSGDRPSLLVFMQPSMAATEIIEVSILEGGAADELAHDGGGRNLLVADSDEVMDELQETMGLAVFRAVFGH